MASAGITNDRRFVAALARGLEVLQAFRYGERWLTHQEIALRTGLPKATVSRLAFTLVALGFLRQDAARRSYQLGNGGLTIGFRILGNAEIAAIARPELEELAALSQAAVSLGVRHQHSMVYIAHARGQARLTLSLDVGARIPIESTSMGRAFLCALPALRRGELERELQEKLGTKWAATAASLKRADGQWQQHGFVTSEAEWESDINAVGAAIDPGTGAEPYAINVGGPVTVLTRERLYDELGPRVAQAAKRIEAALRFQREA
jgi:DNA-binding IclR family transcriptional regulator